MKKDGLSITEYIQHFKAICSKLAAIGEPISRQDHLTYLFKGLDRECNSFVTSIHNQPNRLSLEEIHSLLFSYEFCFEEQNADA